MKKSNIAISPMPTIALTLALASLFLVSCGEHSFDDFLEDAFVSSSSAGEEELLSSSSAEASEDNWGNKWKRGEGAFLFTGYEPQAGKPINVRFYIPTKGNVATMRVLFSMHGAEMNANAQMSAWKSFAENDGFVLITPEYTEENGWTSDIYQNAGLNEGGQRNPPEKWTYNTIEAIFDHFKEHTGNLSEKYDIFGHSAGAQFTHRILLMGLPDIRIRLAVAANPSTWTFPFIDGIKDEGGASYGWQYSVRNTPFANEEAIKRYLAAPLVVHLGKADTSTTDASLAVSAGAMAQGNNRFSRGIKFFNESKKLAEDMNAPFGWRLVEVEGVGHSTSGMVRSSSGAYNLIFKE